MTDNNTSRRRFVATVFSGTVAIASAGTRSVNAGRRYSTQRGRTDTPGQRAIDGVSIYHDRRVFGRDVLRVEVTMTDYARRYDVQDVRLSNADRFAWDEWRFRSVGDKRTHRFVDGSPPPFATPLSMDPFAIKVLTDLEDGSKLTQERAVFEVGGNYNETSR